MTYSTRILVAVADLRRREPILTRLTLAGYPARIASSGLEAVELLKRGVEALVLDIDIPGRNCLEILSWMDRTGRLPKFPVLLVAEQPQPDILRRAGQLGVRACLRAPVDQLELLGRVRAMLADARRQEDRQGFERTRDSELDLMPSVAIEVVAQERPVDVSIGLKIAAARRQARLSQGELGRRVALRDIEMAHIERGERAVTAAKLHAIAEALAVPLASFFDRSA